MKNQKAAQALLFEIRYGRLPSGRAGLLFILIVLVIFGQITTFYFINYDDPINIINNALIKTHSAENLFAIWKAPHAELYIPVTYSVWTAISYISHLFTGNTAHPFFYHTANLLLHIVNTFFVYRILRFILNFRKSMTVSAQGRMVAPFLGALVFAVHPVQVEPVAWATGLKDLLYVFFSLSALQVFLSRYAATGRKSGAVDATRIYLASTLLFILAVLSKPTAIVLPALLLIILMGLLKHSIARRELAVIGLWFLISFGCIILTKTVQSTGAGGEIALYERILVACDAIVFYICKILFPFFPSLDYGRTIASVTQNPWRYFLPPIVVMIPVLLFFLRNKFLWLSCLALIVVGVAPVSGFIPFEHQRISTVADRYLYLSMFGVAATISFIVSKYYNRKLIMGICLISLVFGAVSINYCSYWKNTETLMRYTVTRNPESFTANHNLGIVLMNKGRLKAAIPRFHKAIQIHADSALAHYNLALAYALDENEAAAYKQQRALAGIKPDKAKQLKKLISLILKSVKSEKMALELQTIIQK